MGRTAQTMKERAPITIVSKSATIPNTIKIDRTKTPKKRNRRLNIRVLTRDSFELYLSFILIQGEKSVDKRVGTEKK